MANIKSAIKRNRQSEKRRVHNLFFRSSATGYVHKANLAIQSGDSEKAKVAVAAAASALDKAAAKHIIHKNNAARRKGALMGKLAALQPSAASAAATAPAPKAEAKAKPKARAKPKKPKKSKKK